MLEYDPYGRSRRWAKADHNMNGSLDSGDISGSFLVAHFAGDMSADQNEDGSVSTSDIFAFLSDWFAGDDTPRDALSHALVDNPYGYCGYYGDSETLGLNGDDNGFLYQCRHRVYDPMSGRWLQRDPAGFVDGMNLYGYYGNDPYGLSIVTGCDGGAASGPSSIQMMDEAAKQMEQPVTQGTNEGTPTASGGSGSDFDWGAGWAAVKSHASDSWWRLALAPGATSLLSTLENIGEAWSRESNLTFGQPTVLGLIGNFVALETGMAHLGNAIAGADPATMREMGTLEQWTQGVTGALKGISLLFAGGVGGAAIRGASSEVAAGANAIKLPEGSFSIIDWNGYPANIPRPVGPFRLLEGAEYDAARAAANQANRAIRRTDPTLKGLQIHEIQPVKFGGSPTAPANKIPLTPQEHAPTTTWWNQLQRELESTAP